MLQSIDFDDQLRTYAAEVDDESFDRLLPAETGAIEILHPDVRPQPQLGLGRVLRSWRECLRRVPCINPRVESIAHPGGHQGSLPTTIDLKEAVCLVTMTKCYRSYIPPLRTSGLTRLASMGKSVALALHSHPRCTPLASRQASDAPLDLPRRETAEEVRNRSC